MYVCTVVCLVVLNWRMEFIECTLTFRLTTSDFDTWETANETDYFSIHILQY